MATKKAASKVTPIAPKTAANKTATKTVAVAKAPAKKAAAKKAPAKSVAAAKPTVKESATPVKAKLELKTPPTYDQIAQLAYHYSQQRGHHHGSQHEDWLRAERDLNS